MFQTFHKTIIVSCVLWVQLKAFDIKGFDDTILYKLNWGAEAEKLLVRDT